MSLDDNVRETFMQKLANSKLAKGITLTLTSLLAYAIISCSKPNQSYLPAPQQANAQEEAHASTGEVKELPIEELYKLARKVNKHTKVIEWENIPEKYKGVIINGYSKKGKVLTFEEGEFSNYYFNSHYKQELEEIFKKYGIKRDIEDILGLANGRERLGIYPEGIISIRIKAFNRTYYIKAGKEILNDIARL